MNLYDALPELRYDIEKMIESRSRAVHNDTEWFAEVGEVGESDWAPGFYAASGLLSHIVRELNKRRPVAGSRRSWFINWHASIRL